MLVIDVRLNAYSKLLHSIPVASYTKNGSFDGGRENY
jgi:hypothetical protein